MEYDEFPAALIDKRKELEAAMSAVITAGDLATPAAFGRVYKLRSEYDEAVSTWIFNMRSIMPNPRSIPLE